MGYLYLNFKLFPVRLEHWECTMYISSIGDVLLKLHIINRMDSKWYPIYGQAIKSEIGLLNKGYHCTSSRRFFSSRDSNLRRNLDFPLFGFVITAMWWRLEEQQQHWTLGEVMALRCSALLLMARLCLMLLSFVSYHHSFSPFLPHWFRGYGAS